MKEFIVLENLEGVLGKGQWIPHPMPVFLINVPNTLDVYGVGEDNGIAPAGYRRIEFYRTKECVRVGNMPATVYRQKGLPC